MTKLLVVPLACLLVILPGTAASRGDGGGSGEVTTYDQEPPKGLPEAYPVVALRAATLQPIEGDPYNVTGGFWLDDHQAHRIAFRLKEADRVLKGTPNDLLEPPLYRDPPMTDWLIPAAVGAAIGLLGGILLVSAF